MVASPAPRLAHQGRWHTNEGQRVVEPEARGRCVRTPRVSLDNKCALSETGCVPSNSPEIWRALLATPPLRGHMALLLLGVLSPAGALLAGADISPTDRARNFWVLCGRDGVPPAGAGVVGGGAGQINTHHTAFPSTSPSPPPLPTCSCNSKC